MSKVSFRAKALDASKPMPVYLADEIPDLPDFAAINRSVPQMPTGMEKEEESEHHLQRALSAQQVFGTVENLVIPIPEVSNVADRQNELYTRPFKLPKQYVHVAAFGMDQEIPDYDMDSEDESWLDQQTKKMEISPSKFEEMMDRLEKGSGQQVVTLHEAKALLKEDDDLIIAVYDYWLNKRLRTQHPLILSVKTEKRDGSTTNNPYVAFRRRTEKMQTRKNRKNDETSYERMLKLKRDISRALTVLEMMKRREKTKKENLQLTIEVLEKRYQMEDFSGQHLAEAEKERMLRPSIPQIPLPANWAISAPARKKREYKKRRTKESSIPKVQKISHQPAHYGDIDVVEPDVYSSDDEGLSPGLSPSDHEDENDPDGMFAFRRKRFCHYHSPLLGRTGNWPWCAPEDGGLGDSRYRYSLMSLPPPRRCVGFARRRIGRGGRVIIDRSMTPWDDSLSRLDLSSDGTTTAKGVLGDYFVYIRDRKIAHYRPHTPPPEEDSDGPSSSHNASFLHTFEVTPESFHCHQEQLLAMQRQQHERLQDHQDTLRHSSSSSVFNLDSSQNSSYSNSSNGRLDQSFSSQPRSLFTLDSASAKFAASAVISSQQLLRRNYLSMTTLSTMPTTTISTTAVNTCAFITTSALSSLSQTSILTSGLGTLSSLSSKLSSSSSGANSLSLSNLPSSLSSLSSSSSGHLSQSLSSQPLLSLSSSSPSVLISSLSSPALLATGLTTCLTNGPLTKQNKSIPALSSLGGITTPSINCGTAPAVLQLNFPLATAAVTPTSHHNYVVNSGNGAMKRSSSPASILNVTHPVISGLTSSKAVTGGNSLLKAAVAPTATTVTLESLVKQGHEEANSLNKLAAKDAVVAMDVT